MLARRSLLLATLGGLLLVVPSRASELAEPVPPSLMSGLAAHAAGFEQMKVRGAFTLDGKVEEIDGEGHASETKEIKVRLTPRPGSPVLADVIRYTENGVDKTAEAREKAAEARAKAAVNRAKKPKKEFRFPFLASEQARYSFALVGRDPAHASRVKISFVPLVPAEDAFKGSAWVDADTSSVLSMGFSPTRNPMFVDHVDIQVTFGLQTPLGRAPSEILFDGRGGFLVIRKHYRGKAVISNPRLAF